MPALPTLSVSSLGKPPASQLDGITHVLVCGSVDDGKSTLIGRLLWDTAAVYEDQRAGIVDHRDKLDFSRLVDGLMAEREQGITIDIAWRYIEAGSRRMVIIDSPGHEQYTRNMASGASHADTAILLVDARHGIKRQTRRHAALLSLFGVKRVVLAVNKMDLVDWSEDRFCAIAAEFETLCANCEFDQHNPVPICAVGGDNVVNVSDRTAWYRGPSLIEKLAGPSFGEQHSDDLFRFPVQYVLRDDDHFRGLAGTVASGTVRRGDPIVDAASGQAGRVKRITTMGGDLDTAEAGQAITIVLDGDFDISRGAVLSSPARPPQLAKQFEGRIIWLSEVAFDPGASYLLRTATDVVSITQVDVTGLLDLEAMSTMPSFGCAVNELADVAIHTAREVAIDRFSQLQETGSFLLVDAATGSTVAGGVVTAVNVGAPRSKSATFQLTEELLASGLCSDLGSTDADREEFRRRSREVATILKFAGVRVEQVDDEQLAPLVLPSRLRTRSD